MPKISVIVPIYKVEKYLRECVDSILAQTFKDFELILVDDGSPDGCGAICDEYRSRDERVVVIHKQNGGVVEARIAGVEKARGDYIVFIDSDDRWTRTALSGLWAATKNGMIDFVCAGFIYEEFDGSLSRIVIPKFLGEYEMSEIVKKPFKTLFDFTNMCVWGGAFARKSVLAAVESIKNCRINVFEDGLFIVAIFLNSKKVCFLRDPFYYYVMRQNSALHQYNSKVIDAGEKCCETMEFILRQSQLFSRERIDEIVAEHSAVFSSYAFLMLAHAPSFRERVRQMNLLRHSKIYQMAKKRKKKSIKFCLFLAVSASVLLSETYFFFRGVGDVLARKFVRCSGGG